MRTVACRRSENSSVACMRIGERLSPSMILPEATQVAAVTSPKIARVKSNSCTTPSRILPPA